MKVRLLPLLVGLTVAACAGSGCTAGPNHTAPELELPVAHAEIADSTRTEATEVWAVEGAWWENFDRPQLTALIEQALEANLDLRIAWERLQEVRALRGAAEGSRGPSVSGTASYTEFDTGRRSGAFAPLDEAALIGVGGSWEIDVFGAVTRRIEALAASEGRSVEEMRATWVAVVGEVCRSWFDLEGSRERLAVAEDNLRLRTRTLELVRARRESGLARRIDEERAIQDVESLRAQIPRFAAAVRASENRLAVLTGRAPRTAGIEASGLPEFDVSVDLGIPPDLLRRRPDIRAAERRIAEACAAVGIETAELYPRFFLFGQLALQSEPPTDLTSPASRIVTWGPSMQWRLFESGALRRRIEAAEARHRVRLLEYERIVLEALEDVDSHATRFARAKEEVRALEAAASAARETVDQARALYDDGLEDFLTVLDAQRGRNDLEDAVVEARGRALGALSGLQTALGGAWILADPPAE